MRGWTLLEEAAKNLGFAGQGLKVLFSDSVADDPVRISAELHPAAGRIQCFRVIPSMFQPLGVVLNTATSRIHLRKRRC